MKRILLVAFLVALAIPARADIVPRDLKSVRVTAVIENLSEFPEYTFVAVETLGSEIRAQRVVGPDGRLDKGYKLDRLQLLAVPASRLKNGKPPDALELLGDPDVAVLAEGLQVGQELVPRDSPLVSRMIRYRITEIANGKIQVRQVGESAREANPARMSLDLMLKALVWTAAVELLGMLLLMRLAFRRSSPGPLRIATVVLAAQMVTLPLLWYAMSRFLLVGTTAFLLGEGFAVVAEGAVYRFGLRLGWGQALFASLVCNALSVLAGMLA